MPDPHATFANEGTYTPEQLLAGDFPRIERKVAIATFTGTLAVGSALGRVAGTISAPVAFAGNVGNGTFAATPTAAAGIKEGDYKLVIVEPGTNVGTFVLHDPDGLVAGIGVVASAFAAPLAFTLQDGSTDFAAGDGFTISVAKGTDYNLSLSAAADGSHLIQAILSHEVVDDGTGGQEAIVYETGHFNEEGLVLGTGHTIASVRERLKLLGIHLSKRSGG